MSTAEPNPDSPQAAAFPANRVEEALDAALARPDDGTADTALVQTFVAALREGEVWVPLPEGSGTQEDGSIALPTLELEGTRFIPVFTSEGQLNERSAGLPFTVLPARELAGVMPEGVGLALNPGNTASVPIHPDTVAALAR
ncbi:MAG: SseB family protein [Nocardiopsaceae bacterium]|nr:SseB family protein [Nocardiopsaceae bacterium]